MHKHSCLEIGRCNQGSGVFNIKGKVNKMQSKCTMIVYQFTLHSAKSNRYDLAKMCNLSSSSLRREFYLFSNMSPMNYLSYVRIKNAAVLLFSTNKTILEISSDVGYNDVSSFNR